MANPRRIATWFDARGFDARRRIVATALAGWIVLIVMGAGPGPDSTSRVSIPDLSNVLVAIFFVMAVVGLVVLPFVVRGVQGPRRRRATKSLWPVFLVAAAFVLAPIIFGESESEDAEQTEQQQAAGEQEEGAGEADDGTGAGDIAALLLTATVAGAVLVWSHRRLVPGMRNLGDEPALLDEAELGPAIDEAADLLMFGRDPRMAVLAAYAALERALSEHGHSRNPADTPSEHLARVLAAVPVVAEPSVRLGELYEVARFSDHQITRDDQQLAARALDRARRQLAASMSEAR